MNRIPPPRMNCDALAPSYEFLEHLSFGRYLERSRFAYLPELGTARRALLCGGGDGRFLARLLSANLRVEVDFVDLSPRMIELAALRSDVLGPSFRQRVSFHATDIREFQPRSDRYDLIVTNFFLDCFLEQQLPGVVSFLAGCALPHMRWVVSDFRQADGAIGRLWTGALIRSLYAAFRLVTGLRVTRLPNYPAALASRGLLLRREQISLGGLLHSSLWTF